MNRGGWLKGCGCVCVRARTYVYVWERGETCGHTSVLASGLSTGIENMTSAGQERIQTITRYENLHCLTLRSHFWFFPKVFILNTEWSDQKSLKESRLQDFDILNIKYCPRFCILMPIPLIYSLQLLGDLWALFWQGGGQGNKDNLCCMITTVYCTSAKMSGYETKV